MRIYTNFFLHERRIKRIKIIDKNGEYKVIERNDIRCPKCGSKWVYVIYGSIHLYTRCKSCGAFESHGIIVWAETDD